MNLVTYVDKIEEVKVNKKEISEIVDKIFRRESYRAGNINIIITSDRRLLEINKKYLKRDYLTDIITFGSIKKEAINGEIYISYERVKFNAEKYSDKNIELELYRIIIHGILHLMGYNDLSVQEKLQMTQKEDFYLKELNLPLGRKE